LRERSESAENDPFFAETDRRFAKRDAINGRLETRPRHPANRFSDVEIAVFLVDKPMYILAQEMDRAS
jgi:hypothetical protein